jgi:hypothetical protein
MTKPRITAAARMAMSKMPKTGILMGGVATGSTAIGVMVMVAKTPRIMTTAKHLDGNQDLGTDGRLPRVTAPRTIAMTGMVMGNDGGKHDEGILGDGWH